MRTSLTSDFRLSRLSLAVFAATSLLSAAAFAQTPNVVTGGNNAGDGGVHLIGAAQAHEIDNIWFVENKARNGGAIHNSGTLTLTDVSFYRNNATTANGGGALFLAGGSTTHHNVSAGLTSYIVGNTGGAAATARNSLRFVSAANNKIVYNINTNEGATLAMLDPISIAGAGGANGGTTINKNGKGVWQLAGTITDMTNGADDYININDGTLELLAAGTQTVTLHDGSTVTVDVQAADLALGAYDRFAMSESATILVRGGNKISGGGSSDGAAADRGIAMKATLAFDMAGAKAATSAAQLNPMLDMSGAILNAQSKIGNGVIRIYNDENLNDGLFVLVQAKANEIVLDKFFLGDSNTEYVTQRSKTVGAKMMGVAGNANNSALALGVVAADSKVQNLTWTGTASQVWDNTQTPNWNGSVAVPNFANFTLRVNSFLNGDDVIFDATSAADKRENVRVVADGVTVGKLTVNADTQFSGGSISATDAVTVAANTALGLTLNDGVAALSAKSLAFGNGAKLNIGGYVINENLLTLPANERLLIETTDGVTDWGNVKVTVAGESDADFLTANAVLNDNNVNVRTELRWFSTDAEKKAHGNFTIADGQTFTLDGALADNGNAQTTWADGWDGATLTKLGGGTLALNGDHSYSGDTFVNGGTLLLNGSVPGHVNVAENARFVLRGSVGSAVNAERGAVLDFYGGASMADLSANDATLGFFLPHDMNPADVLVNVGGVAALNGAKIALAIDGGTRLANLGDGGDIVLLNAEELSANDVESLTAKLGSTIRYDVTLRQEGAQLLANLVRPRLEIGAKALSEGFLSGAALLVMGDELAQKAVPLASAQAATTPLFGIVQAGKNTFDTGSSIELNAVNALTGAAMAQDRWTVGGFFEFGRGNATTENLGDENEVIHGDADVNYVGVGALGKFAVNDKIYLESVLRVGRVKTDFDSGDLSSLGNTPHYQSSGTYVGASLAGGYVMAFNDETAFDLYGKLIWLRQSGDDVTLGSGESAYFDAINSLRLRVGTRLTQRFSAAVKGYANLALDYECDGKADARVNEFQVDAPEMKGASGMLGIGLTLVPMKNQPLTVNLNAQGYVGKREGVSGGVEAVWQF
jgi:autotransporter-associated beta strand protein